MKSKATWLKKVEFLIDLAPFSMFPCLVLFILLSYCSRISLNSIEHGHNTGPQDRLQAQTSLQHNSYAEMFVAQQQRASLGCATLSRPDLSAEQIYVNARSSGKRRSTAAASHAAPLLRQGSRLCESQQNQQDKLLCHQKNDRLNQELNFSFHVIENDIKEIRDYLRHTRKRIQVTDVSNKNMNEWKRLALILDRTLFFIYIIVIVISMTLMFPRWSLAPLSLLSASLSFLSLFCCLFVTIRSVCDGSPLFLVETLAGQILCTDTLNVYRAPGVKCRFEMMNNKLLVFLMILSFVMDFPFFF